MARKILIVCILHLFVVNAYGQKLYIYGGEEQNEFLGCLNSSGYDSDSIWNEYGRYGNPYNSKSIWNAYGSFGNEYDIYSPWNEYSLTPPIIVDEDGNFYGYLTRNKVLRNRATFNLVMMMYGNYEEIRDDVSEWYDRFSQMGLIE